MNLSIQGDGYFVFQEDGGTLLFSRDGNLGLDRSGFLTNAGGLRTQPPLSVPPDATRLDITRQGDVLAVMPDGSSRHVGALQLATFNDPNQLQGLGVGMHAETLASGHARLGAPGEDGLGLLTPADTADGMIELIRAEHGVAASAALIRAADRQLGTTVDLLG